jgi:hypothetical protein
LHSFSSRISYLRGYSLFRNSPILSLSGCRLTLLFSFMSSIWLISFKYVLYSLVLLQNTLSFVIFSLGCSAEHSWNEILLSTSTLLATCSKMLLWILCVSSVKLSSPRNIL